MPPPPIWPAGNGSANEADDADDGTACTGAGAGAAQGANGRGAVVEEEEAHNGQGGYWPEVGRQRTLSLVARYPSVADSPLPLSLSLSCPSACITHSLTRSLTHPRVPVCMYVRPPPPRAYIG